MHPIRFDEDYEYDILVDAEIGFITNNVITAENSIIAFLESNGDDDYEMQLHRLAEVYLIHGGNAVKQK